MKYSSAFALWSILLLQILALSEAGLTRKFSQLLDLLLSAKWITASLVDCTRVLFKTK